MTPHNRVRLILVAAGFYLVLAGGLLFSMWRAAEHHLVYTLDDPYIHMALAERIAIGHYGLNAGEASSPSSSLLWPLLLTPTAQTGFALYMPLLLNILPCLVSCGLIGALVAEWPTAKGRNGKDAKVLQRTLSEPMGNSGAVGEGFGVRALTVVGLVLTGNLVGLTAIGMEHSLQVMLTLACAFGICRVLAGRPMPAWSVAAAVVAPWLRYEDLGLTLAVGVALVATGLRRRAAVMAVAAVAPLIGFSVFLHRLGLPLLPLSVLVKGFVAEAHVNPVARAVRIVMSGVYQGMIDTTRWPVVVLFLSLCWSTWREREPVRRLTLAGATAAVGLHLLIGRFGWFYRYEVYVLVFAAVLVLWLMQEREARLPVGWYALGLVALATPYVHAIEISTRASRDVYGQQYQMARFAHEYYKGNFAVNDLGLVSYRLPPSQYVLDVLGLGSLEAARQPHKDAAWVQKVTTDHHVGLVMVYRGLAIPAEWQPLGRICEEAVYINDCADFWIADPAQAAALQEEFARFRKTLPGFVSVNELRRE